MYLKNANSYENGPNCIFSRVHISEATFQCLNGVYEVDPGEGQERDAYLRAHDVKTYLIKQIEPMRSRKRLASRPRYIIVFYIYEIRKAIKLCFSIFSNKLWPDDKELINPPQTPSTPATPPPISICERSDSGIQHSTIDDENTTDWTPEIPFENVLNLLLVKFLFFKSFFLASAYGIFRYRRRFGIDFRK